MSVFLLILKIMGIILLVLLCVLVFLVLGVLFVPFVYRIRGSYHTEGHLKGSIYGLGYLAGAGIVVSGNEIRPYVRIFGIRKFLSLGNKEEKIADNTSDHIFESSVETPDRTEVFAESDTRDEAEEKTEGIYTDQVTSVEGKKPKTRRSPAKIVSGWWNKIRQILENMKRAVQNIRQTIGKIHKCLTDESHKRAFTRLRSECINLLKMIMPRRLRLTLDYATGSPDTTAQILGLLAMFPVGYQNRWSVHPDFEADKAYVDAEFDVKGHLFGFQLLKLILGLVLDKDCQKLYNHFKAMKE